LNSLVNILLDNPMTQFSFKWILSLNRLCQKWGQVHIYSEYRSFDKVQADFLTKLGKRFGVWNSIFYLWYNPPCAGFPEKEQKLLRAYDAGGGPALRWHGPHMLMEEMCEMGFPWLLGSGSRSVGTPEDETEARQWRLTQPALRLSDLDVVQSVSAHENPRLKALYEATLTNGHRPAFSPFADFLLFSLVSSRYGSDKPEWLRLTEGQRVAMPPIGQPPLVGDELDLVETVPTPRHTLRISVRGTLPQIG
jgi:hypothetical protein